MHFKQIKIGNSFLILLALYILGYTHFLGGPYGLAKFLFLTILVFTLIFLFFVFGFISYIKKIFKKQVSNSYSTIEEKGETIKVDATIVD